MHAAHAQHAERIALERRSIRMPRGRQNRRITRYVEYSSRTHKLDGNNPVNLLENDMQREIDRKAVIDEELEKQRLDRQLDRELEATFPASDALKITRRQPDTPSKPRRRIQGAG